MFYYSKYNFFTIGWHCFSGDFWCNDDKQDYNNCYRTVLYEN